MTSLLQRQNHGNEKSTAADIQADDEAAAAELEKAVLDNSVSSKCN